MPLKLQEAFRKQLKIFRHISCHKTLIPSGESTTIFSWLNVVPSVVAVLEAVVTHNTCSVFSLLNVVSA